jgi:APA family basic amino acid/polyamine antiporter
MAFGRFPWLKKSPLKSGLSGRRQRSSRSTPASAARHSIYRSREATRSAYAVGMKIGDETAEAHTRRQLSLFDAVCIVVGIIIGSSIFRSPKDIAGLTGGIELYFLAWALGGAISLLGSLCFAELATRYPEHGGAYAYLRRAFGDRAGFFYAWTEFWLVRPGNVGIVALVFAPAFCAALGQEENWNPLYVTLGVVIVVTLFNLLGLKFGVWGQNAFTSAKVIGLVLVVLIGLGAMLAPASEMAVSNNSVADATPMVAASVSATTSPPPTTMARLASFWQAMVFVMFAYGGWSDMAMVSAEVRDPRKNLFRALILGAATVTVIYLLVNLAYFLRLGFEGIKASDAPAQDLISGAMGKRAGRVMSGLVCISCLGSIQGLIFTGARVQFALGRDHRLFAWLGEWNTTTQVPMRALLAQCLAAIALLLAAWLSVGRAADAAGDSFGLMVNYTGVVYWGSLVAVAGAFLVLRDRDHAIPGFRTPWFPVVALFFVATMTAMTYAAVRYTFFAKLESGEGLGWFAMAMTVFATGILLGGTADSAKSE